MAISSRIVPMPMARDSHSAVAISRGGLGGLLFHIVLGEIGDLVGERLEFGSDRQRDFAGDADGFFVQLRNLCCGVGAAAAAAIASLRTAAICWAPLRIVFRSRLELLDAGTVFGGLGQFQHLVGKLVRRFQPGREIVVGLLQIRRDCWRDEDRGRRSACRQRRLRIHRVPRDRLLPGHARVEIAHRRVGPDLDNHHRGDEQNAEARGDAELGTDGQIEKETGDARHGLRP